MILELQMSLLNELLRPSSDEILHESLWSVTISHERSGLW